METVADSAGRHVIYYPQVFFGEDFFLPGRMPGLFAGFGARWNFASLMLALFCGGAVMGALQPGRAGPGGGKTGAVAMGTVGLVFLLTLWLGAGALADRCLDPADSNRTASLLAADFGGPAWVLFSLAALGLVIGTMRRLLATAQSLSAVTDDGRPGAGGLAMVIIAAAAIGLAILLRGFNTAFLAGWAFNIAAAILPALVLPQFWKGATAQGIAASIYAGSILSVARILLPADMSQQLNQPAIAALPLAALTLVTVSRFTQKRSDGAA
jgi:cation/acetate symporter